MKIFVASFIDSPPHAVYASEELFNEYEKSPDAYMNELEFIAESPAKATACEPLREFVAEQSREAYGSFCGGMPPSEQVKRARNER